MIEAELKGITWLEKIPIEQYAPDPSKPFSIELSVRIGPKGLEGEEIFLVDVSNALFLADEAAFEGPHVVRSTIVVERFSVTDVESVIRDFCKQCRGETWEKVAYKLMRLGRWEFEDMVEGI